VKMAAACDFAGELDLETMEPEDISFTLYKGGIESMYLLSLLRLKPWWFSNVVMLRDEENSAARRLVLKLEVRRLGECEMA